MKTKKPLTRKESEHYAEATQAFLRHQMHQLGDDYGPEHRRAYDDYRESLIDKIIANRNPGQSIKGAR
jgi:hypothetical protein